MGEFLTKALSDVDAITLPIVENGTTNAYYMYPIKLDIKKLGISRNTFVRAVSAELPRAYFWDTTPLAEGYVKPLYLNPIYKNKIALGSKGFPFNLNLDRDYTYAYGDCPVTESLYENDLIITPLIRDGIYEKDLQDFVNAFKKVIRNIDLLRESDANKDGKIYDPIAAIEENVRKDG